MRRTSVSFYEKQLVKLKSDKKLLELELEDVKPPDPNADFIAYELVPLGRGVEHQPDVEKAVVAFRKKYPKKKTAPIRTPPSTGPRRQAPPNRTGR